MARTIGEIYTSMVEEKQSQASLLALTPELDNEQQLLADLKSSSKVAVWRLYFYIIAVAIHYHELLFDKLLVEVKAVADAAIVGTVAWYQKQVYDFQLGVSLVFDEEKLRYVYETIDPLLQIVKRCAIVERADGVLLVKAAKLSGLQPIALEEQEQLALISYIKKVRFAGTRFVLVSGSGDQIKIRLNVYYDPIALLNNVKTNVELAINAYISALPFNGVLQTSALVDAVQDVPGVSDVTVTTIETRYITGGVWQQVGRTHTPNFGYYTFDPAAANQLPQTINYIAV